MESTPSSNACASCSAGFEQGAARYIVTISSFADVETELPLAELSESEKSDLLAKIEGMTEEELNSSVYDKRVYVLCTSCRNKFIDSPFGGIDS